MAGERTFSGVFLTWAVYRRRIEMIRLFADRMGCVHRSFVREILKATEDPEIVSSAGGFPDPRYFPTQEVAQAAQKVLSECG